MTEAQFKRTRFAKVMEYNSFQRLDGRVQKYQTFPENCKIKTTDYFNGKSPANLLTAMVIFWMKYEGIYASRNNSTGIPMKQSNGSIKWKPATGMKGSGDIYAVVSGGRSLWIEVKIGRDKQSEVQKKFEAAVIRQGALYWLVKTFEDFHEKWRIYNSEWLYCLL